MTHEQHVVPQVYLKNFAKGKMCYVIDSYGKIRDKSIDGICYEIDFYEFKNADERILYENLAEDTLQKVETLYSDYMDDLLNALDSDRSVFYMRQEDNGLNLVTWMVLMLLRNPLTFSLTPEVSNELGLKWNSLESHNNAVLNISSLLEGMSRKLYKTHKIVFLKNDTDIGFLTSNYPCIIMNDENGETRGYMPLSSKYYVLLIDRKCKDMKEYSVLSADTLVVNHYNESIIRNVVHIKTEVIHKYIISKDRKTLEYYQEYIQKHLSKKSQ